MFKTELKVRTPYQRYRTRENMITPESLVSEMEHALARMKQGSLDAATTLSRKVIHADTHNAACERHEDTISKIRSIILSDVERGTPITVYAFAQYLRKEYNMRSEQRSWGYYGNCVAATSYALEMLVAEGAAVQVRCAEESNYGGYRNYKNAYVLI